VTPIVGIRANADASVGFGHVKRCQSLSDALLALGAGVVFMVNPESAAREWLPVGAGVEELAADEAATLADTARYIESRGITALVVDSYDIGPASLARIRVPITAIVDAPPKRPLPVALVINGAAVATGQHHPLAAGSRALLGPHYVLLRRDFEKGRTAVRDSVERVLITTGGGDDRGLCTRLVRAVRRAAPDAGITVVAGYFFPPATVRDLEQLAASDPALDVVVSPPTLYPLMMAADLAVSAGGQTTYELAATGTPAVAVTLAANQTVNLKGLSAMGTLEWIGDADDPGIDIRIQHHVSRLAADGPARERMSQAGRQVVDGRGAARVAAEILALCA
jgi:spore coat polysaccharide biosynthesis predicted glycosyltransferase SpsG